MPLIVPALMYHDLGPTTSDVAPGLRLTCRQFERQIAWLTQRGYVSITPSDWIAWRNSGRPLPEKPVLITFDDGYASVATHALPILERYGYRAAVFVVTGRIGATNTWDQARGYEAIPLMSADQVSYWALRGIEFGCHSCTHQNLALLTAGQLYEEIVGSREDLTRILNKPPTAFAYPWGFFNNAALECVRSSFDIAFSTRRGVNVFNTDPHLMRRSAIPSEASLLDFACRVRLGLNPLGKLRYYTSESRISTCRD